ncbi:MAG: hypothetical protein EHM59_13095 [Betaproteobacteria bacterium]|nr:MAG: hypothetical protein EHM59_13095 [Betaproteobacteria bacterium]
MRTIAEALAKRPQLSLTIKPAYSPGADGPALQSIAARRAVLTRAGIKLEPGESPGPLDFGNARIQKAIEAQFVDQFGLPAARDLRAGLAKRPATRATGESIAANTPIGESSTPADVPPTENAKPAETPVAEDPTPAEGPSAEGSKAPASRAASLAAIRAARAMSERLIEGVSVSETELAELGRRRGSAIAEELKAAGKVESARVTTVDPHTVEATRGPVVTDLDLAVAK